MRIGRPMRRKDLVTLLETVPLPPHGAPELERVRTPASVAADLLYIAELERPLKGRRVIDLGCGTGIFCLGAAALGATVQGIDIDEESLALARDVCRGRDVELMLSDVAEWTPAPADLVIMNPPFGAQRGNRYGDRLFWQKAVDAARLGGGSVYGLALESTGAFIARLANEMNCSAEEIAAWNYPLQASQSFHRQEAKVLRVAGWHLIPRAEKHRPFAGG